MPVPVPVPCRARRSCAFAAVLPSLEHNCTACLGTAEGRGDYIQRTYGTHARTESQLNEARGRRPGRPSVTGSFCVPWLVVAGTLAGDGKRPLCPLRDSERAVQPVSCLVGAPFPCQRTSMPAASRGRPGARLRGTEVGKLARSRTRLAGMAGWTLALGCTSKCPSPARRPASWPPARGRLAWMHVLALLGARTGDR